MSSGPCAFKQRDVTAAIKAAFGGRIARWAGDASITRVLGATSRGVGGSLRGAR
jgi:hypothetical protein